MKPARLLLAATLAVSALLGAGPAGAIPDTTASIAAARIDAQIKPRLGALLRPPLHRWRPYRPRWRYGRWWDPIYRGGRWCYEYEFDPAYATVQDEYGFRNQYPDFDPVYGGYAIGPGGGEPYYGATGYGGGPGYGGQLAYGPQGYGGRLVGPDYPGAIYTGPVIGPSYTLGSGPLPGGGLGGGVIVDGHGPGLGFHEAQVEAIYDGPQSLRVDCSGHEGLSLREAVHLIGEGGTIYIRGSGGSCREGVDINHSMSLVGEGRSTFDRTPEGPAILAAPNNGPCVRVFPGVKRVELRDLVLEAGGGGRSACVQSWGAEVAIVQTTVHYVGEGCAIYSQGGRLILRDDVIDADTPDAGILAEGSDLEAKRVRVRTRGTAMDVFPRGKDGVHVDEVSLLTGGDGAPRGEVGLIVRGRGGGGGEVDLRHLRIEGFRTGAWLERGGEVSLATAWIGRANLGVVSDGAHLTLQDSVVAAKEVGVYVMTGHASITHNRILDFSDAAIDADRFAEVDAEENWIYPAGGCGAFSRWRSWCRGRGGFGLHLNVDVGLSFGWEGYAFDYPDGYRRGEDHGFDFRPDRRGGGFRGGDYRPPRTFGPDRPLAP